MVLEEFFKKSCRSTKQKSSRINSKGTPIQFLRKGLNLCHNEFIKISETLEEYLEELHEESLENLIGAFLMNCQGIIRG